jgi:hypothetical protein
MQKLVTIRQRLSQLTQTEAAEEKNARELKAESEVQSIIQALDEVIGEYKSEWLINTNLDRELLRTTSQRLQPPSQPGPHEVQWQDIQGQDPANKDQPRRMPAAGPNLNQFGNHNIIG